MSEESEQSPEQQLWDATLIARKLGKDRCTLRCAVCESVFPAKLLSDMTHVQNNGISTGYPALIVIHSECPNCAQLFGVTYGLN